MTRDDLLLQAARARYVLQRLGWPGQAGLAALLLAAAAGAAALGPLRWANVAMEHEAETVAARLQQARGAPHSPADAAADTPAALIAALPSREEAAAFAAFLYKEAGRRGVDIASTEYRTETLLGAEVTRTRIVLPLRGSYAAVRGWIGEALTRHPGAALDELSLRRADDGRGGVAARVQFSLYSRARP